MRISYQRNRKAATFLSRRTLLALLPPLYAVQVFCAGTCQIRSDWIGPYGNAVGSTCGKRWLLPTAIHPLHALFGPVDTQKAADSTTLQRELR